MIERFWARPPRRIARAATAIGLVALTTPFVALLHRLLPEPDLAVAYLPTVMLIAVLAGGAAAFGASIIAFVAYDFLFVLPYFTLTVSDPEEWANLLVFLAVAIATGQLAGIARARALQATRNEREAGTQFRLVRALTESDAASGLRAAAQIIVDETETPAVVIRLGRGNEVGVGAPDLLSRLSNPEVVRDAAILGRADADSPSGRWVRPRRQRLGRQQEAAVERFARVRIPTGEEDGWIVLGPVHPGLGDPNTQRLLVTAAALIGTALRRDRLVQKANEAAVLREGDRLRGSMLNAVSHDLRTPLASIIASAESLLQTDVDWSTQDQEEFLRGIATEGRRLARMVDHLLDYSRVESGALRLAPAWIGPDDLVLDVIQRLKPILGGHPIVADIPPEVDAAFVDEIALGEAIANLIENAASHTPAGTNILVRVRRPDAALEIVVEDDGPGIPLTALPTIFEPFNRTGGSPRARTGGLGLAIARGIVEAHGGSIHAGNRRGGGAQFTITLVQRPVPSPLPDQVHTR